MYVRVTVLYSVQENLVLFANFQYFATSPSPDIECFWSDQKASQFE